MIDKIRIQNFKCLRDVEVELGPLNVLNGPNDSGKASFLEALEWLGKVDLPKDREAFVWQRDRNAAIEISVAGKGEKPFAYVMRLGSWPGSVLRPRREGLLNGGSEHRL